MAEIYNFPLEVTACVVKWLTCKDVCRLAQSCRFFRTVCEIDWIWQNLCFEDYGIFSIENWSVNTFKELYKTVLFKYGFLIGKLWKMNIYPYGGIMSFEAEAGKIAAYLWYPPESPSRATQPFVKHEKFEFKVENEQCICNCLSTTSVHSMENLCLNSSVDDPDGPAKFSFECTHRGSHLQRNDDEDMDFEGLEPFATYAKLSGKIECERMKWSNCFNGESLPKSGLYKAMYGSHGVEVIMVHVSSNQIIGTKITGDPNIPASKVTFKINIDREVSLDDLRELFSTEPGALEVSLKEFRVPSSYRLRDAEDSPIEVKARYHGVGQIAFEGYTNPTWTQVQFALLDDNSFAIFWILLKIVAVYFSVE